MLGEREQLSGLAKDGFFLGEICFQEVDSGGSKKRGGTDESVFRAAYVLELNCTSNSILAMSNSGRRICGGTPRALLPRLIVMSI